MNAGKREEPQKESALPEGVRIRPMKPADIPAVLELEHRLFPHDAWPEQFFMEELGHTVAQTPSQRPTHCYWLAEREGQVCGYAGMMCVLPLADVQTLAVAPELQGQGVGRCLLGLIIDESYARNAEDLLLEVREDNPGAQRLYYRHGFEKIHHRSHYYPDGGDALIMRKRLRDPQPSSAVDLTSDLSDR